ncbi:hypothetical protein OH77DRAFT_577914 [Trametes cingulata]|nr:hypothetical protein OH77DRAFT_577914 [Trametes cingulata]
MALAMPVPPDPPATVPPVTIYQWSAHNLALAHHLIVLIHIHRIIFTRVSTDNLTTSNSVSAGLATSQPNRIAFRSSHLDGQNVSGPFEVRDMKEALHSCKGNAPRFGVSRPQIHAVSRAVARRRDVHIPFITHHCPVNSLGGCSSGIASAPLARRSCRARSRASRPDPHPRCLLWPLANNTCCCCSI